MSTAPPQCDRLLVGCGNMGRAILDAWIGPGNVAPETIRVLDPLVTDLPPGVRGCRELAQPEHDRQPGVIVLAVKPQLVDAVAAQIRAAGIGKGTLLLSILAGVPVARLQHLFPRLTVVRFMANLAAALGRSPVAGYAVEPRPLALAEAVGAVLEPLGPLAWLRSEDELHAVTALAGSGPGFVYRFLDALAQAGTAIGLEPASAARMALATVQGAAALADRSDAPFATLAARVASKGGTTEAGLAVLDADDALARLIEQTLRAAHQRSRDLAAAAS